MKSQSGCSYTVYKSRHSVRCRPHDMCGQGMFASYIFEHVCGRFLYDQSDPRIRGRHTICRVSSVPATPQTPHHQSLDPSIDQRSHDTHL